MFDFQKPWRRGVRLSCFRRIVALVLVILCGVNCARLHAGSAMRPVDYANPLVGTAPLDNQALIGNAPPPGEEIYTGFTLPGPALPHHDITLCPVNKDLTEAAGNHGIIWP